MEVLRQDVDALAELAQAHVRNVARDGRLRAVEADGLKLVNKGALRPNGLATDDVPDGILPVVASLYHVPASVVSTRINEAAFERPILRSSASS